MPKIYTQNRKNVENAMTFRYLYRTTEKKVQKNSWPGVRKGGIRVKMMRRNKQVLSFVLFSDIFQGGRLQALVQTTRWRYTRQQEKRGKGQKLKSEEGKWYTTTN